MVDPTMEGASGRPPGSPEPVELQPASLEAAERATESMNAGLGAFPEDEAHG